MHKFASIVVKRGKKGVIIKNPTGLKLLGKGVQGAVFKISNDRCVKIYALKKERISEAKALLAARASEIVPKVYEVGPNYIVMEYIKGQSLQNYLRTFRVIPASMTRELLFIFKEMKNMGFTRIDASARHLIVSKQGKIKVVDHVNSFRKKAAYPTMFFTYLRKLKLLDKFLKQVKQIDAKQYAEWKSYT